MTKRFVKSAMMTALSVSGTLSLAACGTPPADELPELHANALSGTLPTLLATASLDRATDFAGFDEILENGLPQNIQGGIGSGLAWAGGTTFLGVPDRGPNATAFAAGTPVDNTVSYISRFETLDLALSPASSGALPLTLTPTLQATSLLFSETPLVYGSTPGLPPGAPRENTAAQFYFTGRSDNFGAGLSTDASFARFDPECIRVAPDGKTVFIADEYGPFIYRFDRATGRRLHAYQLPDRFAIAHLSSQGALEISGNTTGRVTNKGMEGLAITPDGSTLVGLMQSPLLQDGGDGGRANRIVTVDVASGATHEYVYDNRIGSKNYNSSEIIALNDHQFLIDTRDGKGLGDGSVAVVKQLWAVDIANATDVSSLSTEAVLLTKAVPKALFLDIVAVLTANGITAAQIPAKIEGLAFGQDVVVGGIRKHTLFVANDNDFVSDVAGPSRWFVFGFTDSDLPAGYAYQPQTITERGPDLAVTSTTASSTAVTGSSVDYTVTATNVGLVPATGVSLTNVLPAGLTFTACAPGTSCTTVGGTSTVGLASLAGAASTTATISATVDCSLADGAVLVSTATVCSATVDPTPADNAATATITVVNPAPDVTGVTVDQPTLWPPNKSMRTVTVAYQVTDNCAGTACTLEVSSNEGSAADWQVLDAHTVKLRADRRGSGSGRTYDIAVRCQDSGGAISTKTATVSVPHNQ